MSVVKVVEAGIATIQDAGRPAARRFGFPAAGPLDVEAWSLANAVVGNLPGAAAVEVLAGTFVAELRGRVALGAFDASVSVDGREVEPWMAVDVAQRVTIVARTTSYLAVAGGIAVPQVLGSRASFDERLGSGDVLPVGDAVAGRARSLPRPPVPGSGPLRVVPGPQAEHFAPDALTAATWVVGPHVDRMGVRLAGAALRSGGGDMLSDGVVPGSIQVPPDGQPIILLADAPTTGGYPKIGVVATVDLGRAGRLRPGDAVGFEVVSVEEAHVLRASMPDLVAASRPMPGPDELLGANLVSGAVDVGEEGAR